MPEPTRTPDPPPAPAVPPPPESQEALAPSAQAHRRMPGPKGCILGAALFGSLGIGCIFVAKLLFDKTNAGVVDGAKQLATVLALAAQEEGAAEVKALGCESAGVLSPNVLRNLAEHLAAEEARKKGRAPNPVDVRATDPVVFCAHPAEGEPTCAKVAEVYVAGGRPTAPFVVTVRTGFREKCVERFGADGKTLGEAVSPNLPLLVAPR